MRSGLLVAFFIVGSTVFAAEVVKPAPPTGVKGVRQDAQAARVQWDFNGNGLGYRVYAAYDDKKPKFHCENSKPLKQTFIIWDAPRTGTRRFAFYVTAIDDQGHESNPSPTVTVDLSSAPTDSTPR